MALPVDSSTETSSTPFHDCLDSGKSWTECRVAVLPHFQDIRRDTPVSGSPFHDCLDSGKSWAECRLTVQDLTVNMTPTRTLVDRDANTTINERQLPKVILGTLLDLGLKFGQSEKCYSVNNLGGTGWLTNTAVQALKVPGCKVAVDQALRAAGVGPPQGKYTDSKQGYYQSNSGPLFDNKVAFFLSVLFQGDFYNVGTDLHQLGNDLCTKGVDHLTADKGCISDRKSGGKVEHTSVNGGEFNYAYDGSVPQFDNTGACTNCIMSMVMEASDKVDKDGSTPVPIDQ